MGAWHFIFWERFLLGTNGRATPSDIQWLRLNSELLSSAQNTSASAVRDSSLDLALFTNLISFSASSLRGLRDNVARYRVSMRPALSKNGASRTAARVSPTSRLVRMWTQGTIIRATDSIMDRCA